MSKRNSRSWLAALAFYGFNSFITHCPSYTLRHFYIRRILRVKLGKEASIHMGCFITGRHISIGNNSVINRKCYLDGRAGIYIGSNVSISPETFLISLTHDPQSPTFATVAKPIYIRDFVWIGTRSMILPGVTLEVGTIVGAGSVVTRSSMPYSIIAGSPAKKISERNRHLEYSLRYFPLFNGDI